MKLTQYLLYPAILPLDLLGWLVVSVSHLLWGKSLGWRDGVLVVELKEDSWPIKTWYKVWGGTTIGHAIFLHPNQNPVVLAHERVHVKQVERAGLAFALAGILVALTGNPLVGLLVWILGPSLVYACGGLVGLCYGDKFYRGNIDEIAAYDRETLLYTNTQPIS